MAESWAAHGSPELRPGDVDALRRHAAETGLAVDADDALGNYFEGRDGRFYCYHFAFYPLLTLPARGALRLVGADVLKAGPLTNAFALGSALAAVLLLAACRALGPERGAALLLSSPVLGFLLWPHPEVLSFAMATLALVAGARGASGVATLCAAVASIQNPPLALLAVFEALRPALARTVGPPSRARVWALVLAAGLALASPLFFLAQFSTPNLAAYETAGAHAMGIGKALGLMLDPELGLVRYAPLTVALLAVLVVGAVRRPSRRVEGALVVVLALMMLLCSATGNWNHGTTGPSRYVVWMFPVIAYLLALGPTASDLLAPPRRTWAATARRRRARAGGGDDCARGRAVAARLPRAFADGAGHPGPLARGLRSRLRGLPGAQRAHRGRPRRPLHPRAGWPLPEGPRALEARRRAARPVWSDPGRGAALLRVPPPEGGEEPLGVRGLLSDLTAACASYPSRDG